LLRSTQRVKIFDIRQPWPWVI